MPAGGASPRRMKAADIISAALIVPVVVWVFVESGQWPAPEFIGGPALIPRVIALLLMACAAVLIWHALSGRSDVLEESLSRTKMVRVSGALLLCLGYAAALERIGFLASTMIFLFAFSIILGMRSWTRMAAYAVGLPIATYLLFQIFLKVPLPAAGWLQ